MLLLCSIPIKVLYNGVLMNKIWLVLFLLSGVSMAAGNKWKLETPLIPRSALFGLDDPTAKGALRISPDGNRLLYAAPVDKVYNLFMCSKNEKGKFDFTNSVQLTQKTNQGIYSARWMHDNKHILYTQDQNGNENNHIYIINIETGVCTDITPFDDVAASGVTISRKFPTKVSFSMNKDNPKLFDPYEIDINIPGSLTKKATNPGNGMEWILDDEWNVRGYACLTPTGGQDIYLGESGSTFSKRFSWDLEDTDTSGFIGFCDDNKSIYILDSIDHNTGKLKRINLDTQEEETVAHDPNYELTNIVIHPETKQIISYNVIKDRSQPTVLDPTFKDDYEYLDSVEDGELRITSMDRELNTWVCCFSYDDKLHNYYLYDRINKSHTLLCKSTARFDAYDCVPMEPISYTTRDGLNVHGYLSRPLDKKGKMPLILMVHGGPWSRDYWGFDVQVQWLCNRGYAVLQVNYRGSNGYGKAFLNAGNKEYGGKMQDDLTDAVNWAVRSGIADPEKVAIFGASYGGYATLAGVTFTPDLYTCAVDLFGRSNLLTITNRQTYGLAWLPLLKNRIGDPDTEEEMLKARSPLFHAHNIKTPILIGQGAQDPRVRQAESDRIVEVLKANNCEHQYMLFPDEGHGFRKHDNRMKFYAAAEAFLAKYLGGRCEA